MKTLLVPIDFSDISNALLQTGAELTRALDGEMLLVHVATPDPDFVGFEVGPQYIRDETAHRFRDEHQRLHGMMVNLQAQGLSVRAFLVQGPTAETILEQAEKHGADMIVMGSHGHGMLHKSLVGSASEGVLRRAHCPVMLVPAARRAPDDELNIPTEPAG